MKLIVPLALVDVLVLSMLMYPLSPPSRVLTSYLIILYALGSWSLLSKSDVPWLHLVQFVALVLGFYVPHLILRFLCKGVTPQSNNLWITLLIMVLLAHNQMSFWAFFVLGLSAWTVKTVLRWRRQPLVNPAAAGFVGLYLVQQLFSPTIYPYLEGFPSWWGVSFSPRLPWYGVSVAMFLTLPVGLYLAYTYRKLPLVIATTLSFAVSYLFLSDRSPVPLLLEGTLAFFVLIMATEPRTSPNLRWQQISYGGIVGALVAINLVKGWLPLAYVMSLIVGNLGLKGYQVVQMYARSMGQKP